MSNTRVPWQRRVAAMIAVPLVAGAAVVGVATGASAAASDCPNGKACGWANAGYVSGAFGTGGKNYISFYYSQSNLANVNYEGTSDRANDNISSIYNNGNSQWVYFYQDAYGRGARVSLGLKRGDADLNNDVGNVPIRFNDRISSGYFDAYRPAGS